MNTFDYPSDADVEGGGPIDFSALRFSDILVLQGEEEQHIDSRTKSIVTSRIVGNAVHLNDQILLFTVVHQQRADQVTRIVNLEKYEFCLQDNENEDEFVDCTIAVQYKAAEGKIVEGFSEALLHKQTKHSQGVFSKGIGIQFYRKALDFIASLAKKKGVCITDTVQQGATASPHGQGRLTNEQWERTFTSVLTDYGYTQTNAVKGEMVFRKRHEPVATQ